MDGLKYGLNEIRELASPIYQKYVPVITEDTDISRLAEPILSNPEIYNEFQKALVNRIVFTQFNTKMFNNPFRVLDGENIPLGYAGQEVYVNPAKGREFNVNDFAGLLARYESDVKVQYLTINFDVQYPVTVSRQTLKKAFTSWGDLERYITDITTSLYNGAYIDEYRAVKQLVAGSYKGNLSVINTIDAPTTEAKAKAFITKARELFLNFQTPSSKYNAWAKIGGYGLPIVTWSNPEDIVIILRNDIRAYMDVNVLAEAFNIDRATLLGNILPVDDFNIYNSDGTLNFDGTNVLGIIADKSWFKIKTQDSFMEEFYNPNNRTMQYFLNNIKMFNMSYFANGVIFATEEPQVTIAEINSETRNVNLKVGEVKDIVITTNPVGGNSPSITYTSSDTNVFTATADIENNKHVIVTGIGAGTKTLTVASGNVSLEITMTVTA